MSSFLKVSQILSQNLNAEWYDSKIFISRFLFCSYFLMNALSHLDSARPSRNASFSRKAVVQRRNVECLGLRGQKNSSKDTVDVGSNSGQERKTDRDCRREMGWFNWQTVNSFPLAI